MKNLDYTLENVDLLVNWLITDSSSGNLVRKRDEIITNYRNKRENISSENGKTTILNGDLFKTVAGIYSKHQPAMNFNLDHAKQVKAWSVLTGEEPKPSWTTPPAPNFNNGVSKQDYLIDQILKQLQLINSYTEPKVNTKDVMNSIDFWSHPNNPIRWSVADKHRTNEEIQRELNKKATQIAQHRFHKYYKMHMDCLKDNDFRPIKAHLASLHVKRENNESVDKLIEKYEAITKSAENHAKIEEQTYKPDLSKFEQLFGTLIPTSKGKSNIHWADEDDI